MSVDYLTNPGYLYFQNVEKNAGLQYYKDLLNNAGVKLYLSQHPELLAKLPTTTTTNPGIQVYQDYLNNEGLRWYLMQHASELQTALPLDFTTVPHITTTGGDLGDLPLLILL